MVLLVFGIVVLNERVASQLQKSPHPYQLKHEGVDSNSPLLPQAEKAGKTKSSQSAIGTRPPA
jgi:hypothetical protein